MQETPQNTPTTPQQDLLQKQKDFRESYADMVRNDGPDEAAKTLIKAVMQPESASEANDLTKYLLQVPDDASTQHVLGAIRSLVSSNNSFKAGPQTIAELDNQIREINVMEKYGNTLTDKSPDAFVQSVLHAINSPDTPKAERKIIFDDILELPQDASQKQILTKLLAAVAGSPSSGRGA